MKNRSILCAMAVTSVLAMSSLSVLAAACGSKCGAKCKPAASASKCGAKCGAKLIQRPAAYKPNYPITPATVAAGEKLFKNTKLSSNGMSCATCHAGLKSYSATFKTDFPHKVNMASNNYGVPSIHLDEVVQMCMDGPMAAKPFDWKSPDLANLVAFISEEQKKFAD